MKSLIDIDTNKIRSAFKIDQSKINVDFGNLNNVVTANELPPLDLEDILTNIKFSISNENIRKLINDLLKGYKEYVEKKSNTDISQISKNLMEYLQSKEVNELLNKEIQNIIKENGSLNITQEQMQKIMSKVLKEYEKYVEENELIDVSKLDAYLEEYLKSEEAKKIISDNLTQIIKSQNLDKQISSIMENYIKTVMSSMSKSIEKEMQASIAKLSN